MTRQQKEIASLQREIKKLKRDNFLLKEKVKDLELLVARWQLEGKNALVQVSKLEEELDNQFQKYEEKLNRADPGWKRRE